MFVLGGLQGVLGWYMVKSGLVDRPDVSQYRLTAHLGAALLIYGYILWVAWGLLFPRRGPGAGGPGWGFAASLSAMIVLTMLSGGFVAGLDAGFAYNTFPLMDGELIPGHLFALSPLFLNFFEDITTVQFTHRVLALVTLALVAAFWFFIRRGGASGPVRRASSVLLALAVLQVTLGISTLVLFVPLPLAAAHQAVAVLLLTAALWTAFQLRPAPRGEPRMAVDPAAAAR
jgi:cytochrome c oxidase assembly protein subunit 15